MVKKRITPPSTCRPVGVALNHSLFSLPLHHRPWELFEQGKVVWGEGECRLSRRRSPLKASTKKKGDPASNHLVSSSMAVLIGHTAVAANERWMAF